MKNLYTLLLFILLSTGLSAQLVDGTKMPDITLTDINGNVHRLQDYLDSGKVVIIDIFATWCGPCWFLHQNHVLADLHEQYGPNGTNEMVIFSIEGDATTSHNDLIGTGTNTQGDWVTGVEYNIVEDNTVPGTFSLTYWPTMYVIRPSGSMLLANDYFFENIYDITDRDFVYEVAFRGENDAAISSIYSDRFFCGQYNLGTVGGSIKNMGTDTLTSATVELFINGELVRTKAWTGNLTEFKSGSVSLVGVPVTENSVIELIVSSPNDTVDLVLDDNIHEWSAIEPEAHQTAKLIMTTDFWPEEISWLVTDPDGNIVVSSSDLGVLACDQTYEQEFPLTADGCYEITLADGYGDGLLNGPINPGSHTCTTENGIANQAMGALSIELDGEVFYSNIAYGTGLDIPFSYAFVSGVTVIENINGLNVYPNPVSDNLTIELTAEKSMEIDFSIVDMTGRIISAEGAKAIAQGQNNLNVDVSNLTAGTYIVRLVQYDAVSTVKFNKM